MQRITIIAAAFSLFLTICSTDFAQGTAFTYQGQLKNNGSPANGSYDFSFALINSGGLLIAGPVTNSAVSVTNGLFTTVVDFGNVFNGSSNWMQIDVGTNGSNSFTALSPRQLLTPTPYAIYSANAGSASTATTAASASSMASSNLTGMITLAQLPPVMVTNNPANLTIGPGNEIAPLTVPPSLPASAVGSVSLGGSPSSVAVAGRYIYVGNSTLGTLQIVDVSTPSAPILVGSATLGYLPWTVAVAGRYAYVANQGDIFHAGSSQLQIVDVSNPSSPLLVGSVSMGSNPISVAVAGHYAYVGSQGTSALLQVIDVSTPSSPIIVGTVPAANTTSTSVAVAGRYAYVANYSAPAFQVVDVSTPSAPTVAGSVTTGAAPEFLAVSGRYAYVGNLNSTNFQVIDVSKPASPLVVGTATTAGKPFFVAVAGRYAYVAMWTPNLVQVFDISTPSNPLSVGTITMPDGLFGPYSIAVSGRYMYVVNGSASTMQVFDFGGAFVQPMEVGALETGTLQTRDTATVGNNLDVRGGLTVSASARISGGLSVDNGNITGSGAGLNNLPAANLTGSVPSATLTSVPAANLTGTVADGQLSSNVALRSGGNSFTGNQTITGGNVGIGTANPAAILDVEGYTYINGITGPYFGAATGAGFASQNNAAQYVSIKSQWYIEAYGFMGVSDQRIKDIVGQSDSRKDLETVESLKVTDYRMKDHLAAGDNLHKGFIAQEVQAVIPEAVTKTRNFIPDVYALADHLSYDKDTQTLRVGLKQAHGLKPGDKVQLILDDGKLEKEVLSVPDDKSFEVGSVTQEPRHLFVYGRQVDDFLAVDYDRIFSTGIGAIQELAKRMEKFEMQEVHLADLEEKASQLAALEQEVADLKKTVAQLALAGKDGKLAVTDAQRTITSASLDQ